MPTPHSSLMQRRLLLFGLLLALSAGVYVAFFLSSAPEVPSPDVLPETCIPMVPAPTAGFPNAIAWVALAQLAESLPSAPGWETRYNAVRALAHKGSKQLPLDVLREMLDEERQLRNFSDYLPKQGRRLPNPNAAHQVILIALKSVSEWHKHEDDVAAVGKDHPDVQRIYAAVDKLAQHSNDTVRKEAENTLKTLGRK